jgi:NADPH:quinone reductase
MQAIHMTATGPADEVLQLVDIPAPEITSPSEIKVRIMAAGINPVDTKLRNKGMLFPDALPAIPGCDGAGTVIETGTAATRFQKGDNVWFCHGGLGGAAGNYAEIKVLEEAAAQPMPAELGFMEAAALPLVLITAWEALFDRADLAIGQTVLIHAGAGGVGHVAIQLAKAAGAHVAATVSTPEKAEIVRQLGADHIILYKDSDVTAAIMEWTTGRGVDVVLDTVGGETFRSSLDAACVYGHVVTLLEPDNDVNWKNARNRNLSISFTLMLTPMLQHLPEASTHQGDILNRCAAMIAEGKLRPLVAKTLPLAEAAQAHRLVEAGHVQGKLVLDIAEKK